MNMYCAQYNYSLHDKVRIGIGVVSAEDLNAATQQLEDWPRTMLPGAATDFRLVSEIKLVPDNRFAAEADFEPTKFEQRIVRWLMG